MTVIVEQPLLETQVENAKEEVKELILDGGFKVPPCSGTDDLKLASAKGFDVPDSNSFGNSFRDYEADTHRKKIVQEFYRQNHINQTVDFVKKMREEYRKFDKVEMSIWECCELLNTVVDESDPDLDEPQLEHLLQTAEAIRQDYPDQDWLQLTGLIHDLPLTSPPSLRLHLLAVCVSSALSSFLLSDLYQPSLA